MLHLVDFKPRLYQETIFHSTVHKNTLVVLPTGLGKTSQALMLAVHRLNNFPTSKVIFFAPSKPLVAQHLESFRKHLDLKEEDLAVFTGEIKPEKREELWKSAKIIFSTPQGFSNDIVNQRILLKNVSCIIFDECHKATGNYDYCWIAQQYVKTADFPRILGLTASPGARLEDIEEVCKNLFIEDIEVRTRDDHDVKPYVQDVEIEHIIIELPEELESVRKHLKTCYEARLRKLKEIGYLHSARAGKGELLGIQKDLQRKLFAGEKDYALWNALSAVAETIKVDHAVNLLETQGLFALKEYMDKLALEAKKVKASKAIVSDPEFTAAVLKVENLVKDSIEHPKMKKLREIVLEEVRKDKEVKVIVFNNLRDSAVQIVNMLNQLENVKAQLFVGQAKKKGTGLSQKEQIAMLNNFRNSEFNVLCATSVGEEGLDIPAVDLVVFYEAVPSAIRKIQRVGRTARHEKGRVVMLLTKDSMDETYRWASQHKEKKMYQTLKSLKNKFVFRNPTQPKLQDFEKKFKVYADSREQSSGIVKDLVDAGMDVECKSLITADFILSDKVGVERKSVQDFVNSIIDKRLLIQAKVLKENFEKPLMIIEGTEDLFSVRNVHPNAIRGTLAAVAISFGIPILYTKDRKDTAELLKVIAKREQGEKGDDFGVRLEKKPLSTKEQQEFIVESLPGVGPTLAKSLLKEFGSVKNIVNAQKEELEQVDKIGKKKAEDIDHVLSNQYHE